MKCEQSIWTEKDGWQKRAGAGLRETAQLVLLFGDVETLKRRYLCDQIKDAYPHAHIVGCSTAGEILRTQVFTGSLVATALWLESSSVKSPQPG